MGGCDGAFDRLELGAEVLEAVEPVDDGVNASFVQHGVAAAAAAGGLLHAGGQGVYQLLVAVAVHL